MVIEVALGVVLGVLILRHLHAIVALSMLLIVFGVVLLIGGAVVYWVTTNEVVFRKVMALLLVLSGLLIGSFVSHVIAKRTVLRPGEICVLLAILLFVCNATVFFIPFIAEWSEKEQDPWLFLYLLPLGGLWIWIWKRTSKLVRKRRNEAKVLSQMG
jgi:hypothetical protein